MGDRTPDFDAIDEAAESFRPSWDTGGNSPSEAPPIVPAPAVIIGSPVISIGAAEHGPLPPPPPPMENARPSSNTASGVAPPAPGSSPSPKMNSTQIGGTVSPDVAAMVAAAQAKIAAANAAAAAPAPAPVPARVKTDPPPAPVLAAPVTAPVERISLDGRPAPSSAKTAPFAERPSLEELGARAAAMQARQGAAPIPIAAVDSFGPGFAPTDDDIVIPQRSGAKVVAFAFVGLLVLGAAGAFVKFGLLSDTPAPAKPATSAAATMAPAANTADIPPPPDKEELAAAAAAAAAAKQPEPTKTAEPAPEPPAPAAAPAPAPAPEPVAHAAPHTTPKVAAAPAPAPKPRAPAPAPAPATSPKTGNKPSSGGIVRDSPF